MPTSDHKRIPQRCEPTDPHACSVCGSHLAMPGTDRCPLHATSHESEIEQTRRGIYDLQRTAVAKRLQEMKGHPEARSLANELGMLRMLLETLLNRCQEDYDLVINEAAITRLILGIQTTLTANQKLEERMGELLSVEHVITLVQMFFEMVKEYIPRIEDQEALATRLTDLLQGKKFTE